MSNIQLCKFFLRSDGSHLKDDVSVVASIVTRKCPQSNSLHRTLTAEVYDRFNHFAFAVEYQQFQQYSSAVGGGFCVLIAAGHLITEAGLAVLSRQ
jgi:hypothetical protein